MKNDKTELITFGGGCFWCTEAVFEKIRGVESVISGYSGGFIKNPSYREVCNGTTGHAEVIQVRFDPSVITLQEILEIFFNTHDPTTLNKQGNDIGTQYRSVIFYHTPLQKEIAGKKINELNASGKYQKPIVTRVEEFSVFYEAEDYHQDYFTKNPDVPYCAYIIRPKLEKLEINFGTRIK